MASLDMTNLLGAASQLTTAFSEERSLKSFLKNVSRFGIQVKNNFEVNFSGLQDVTFFVDTITLPGMKQIFQNVNFDGHVVDVPVTYDWDHTFDMTVLNDAQGYLYTAVRQFMMSSATTVLCPGGYTMTLKALTGDPDHYAGSLITMTGVRFETLGGLGWGQSDNALQTFSIGGRVQTMKVTPGALQNAAGVVGAVDMLMGGR